MKKQKILNGNWDNLIILDACRYDIFEKVYDKYFEADLEKRDSRAGSTQEWLVKNFNELLIDTTYFSANPYINSRGIPLNKTYREDFPAWKPTENFGQIVDVWEKVDNRFNTTMPNMVIESVIKTPSLKRKIIHFIQPHLPFIHPDLKEEYQWKSKDNLKKSNSEHQRSNRIKKIAKNIASCVFFDLYKKIFENPVNRWKMRKPFIPKSQTRKYERIYRNGQLDRVLEFYEYSLKETMKSISKLIPYLSGKTIITADHGECFGEYNLWGHENFNHNPVLTTVPWLKIRDKK